MLDFVLEFVLCAQKKKLVRVSSNWISLWVGSCAKLDFAKNGRSLFAIERLGACSNGPIPFLLLSRHHKMFIAFSSLISWKLKRNHLHFLSNGAHIQLVRNTNEMKLHNMSMRRDLNEFSCWIIQRNWKWKIKSWW